MTVEEAKISDHESLTEITKKSKAYWGYSKEQIEIWKDLLTITPHYIETKKVFKLIIDKKIVGYYSFLMENENILRFDNLFVLPEYIGMGLGKILMNDFLTRIKSTNAKIIVLDSEPHAEKFYAKFGFIKTGEIETLIKDRYLPKMELRLNSL
jgi:ribosomal protein S18 acetylase RimI-like enzyme